MRLTRCSREIPVTNKASLQGMWAYLVVFLFVLLCAGCSSFIGTPNITTPQLPNAQAGVRYSAALNAQGGIAPYHWSIASGTLPAGLSLNVGTGGLSGTAWRRGQFDFSVQVSDSSSPKSQTAMKALTLSVVAIALQITSSGLPSGQVGAPFQASISTSGGLAPYTWAVAGALPPGLNLNTSSGVIAGTPTQIDAATFFVAVQDSTGQSVQKSFSITIAAASAHPLSQLAVTTTALPQPVIQQAYSQTLQATGGTPPYTWSVASGQLPAGLALSSAGQIAGAPTAVGQSSFTVQVADSASPPLTAPQAFSITVAAASAPSALDQYGGDANHACAGTMKDSSPIRGATGFFYLYKDTNLKRWMFCDPAGNRFWMLGVQVAGSMTSTYSNIVDTKYGGGEYDWPKQEIVRLKSIGFNTIGEYANLHFLPISIYGSGDGGNPNKMAWTFLRNPSGSLLANGANSTKTLIVNLPPAYTGHRGGNFPDVWDSIWINGLTPNPADNTFTGGAAAIDANPYLIGFSTDDTDNLYGFGGNGPAHLGWIAAVGPPYVAYEDLASKSSDPRVVFSDPVNHTKQQWSTWLCGTRYASLTLLNAAWGSNYTTCGSTATTATAETIGTGTGSQTSFTYTFSHTPVDPSSIGISADGVLQGGDCPWYVSGGFDSCAAAGSGHGLIQAATGNINGGQITYASGSITVTFSTAPANGVSITATYQYGGWPKALGRGTGLLDEDGTSSWWPTDPYLGFPAPITGTVALDLDAFLGQISKQYFSANKTAIKSAFPHHLIFGPDPLGSTTRAPIIRNAAPYVDAMISGPSVANYNLDGVPVFPWYSVESNTNSPFNGQGCSVLPCFDTQELRGASYLSTVTSYLNTTFVGADGYGFTVGLDWWQMTDNSSESQNFGLMSLRDNLYNGIESCGKSVVDAWGFTTTAEPTTGCYGDFITPVKAANRIWLGP
jgi:hypothetical protein